MKDIKFIFVKNPPSTWYKRLFVGLLRVIDGLVYMITFGRIMLQCEFYIMNNLH